MLVHSSRLILVMSLVKGCLFSCLSRALPNSCTSPVLVSPPGLICISVTIHVKCVCVCDMCVRICVCACVMVYICYDVYVGERKRRFVWDDVYMCCMCLIVSVQWCLYDDDGDICMYERWYVCDSMCVCGCIVRCVIACMYVYVCVYMYI